MTAIPLIPRPLDPSTPSDHPAGTEIRQRQGEAHDPPASPARTVASPCLRGDRPGRGLAPLAPQPLDSLNPSAASHGASLAAGVVPPFSSGAAHEAGGGAGWGDGSPDSTCGMDCSRAAPTIQEPSAVSRQPSARGTGVLTGHSSRIWRQRLDAAMVDVLDGILQMRALLMVPGMPIPRAAVNEVIDRGRRQLLDARRDLGLRPMSRLACDLADSARSMESVCAP